MAAEAAPRPRDWGPFGTTLLYLIAALVGVGVAGFVFWDASYGRLAGIKLLGEQPPLVNDVPFLLTMLGSVFLLILATVVGWLVKSEDFDRPICALFAFSLVADAAAFDRIWQSLRFLPAIFWQAGLVSLLPDGSRLWRAMAGAC